ncbi:MAG: dephospho-CoA kinase [Clostridia bacterium]|nr:dephospho-CoA kinase [Clostridia bacterium]
MVIGVTGGIGCGKSTVSAIISKKLNAPILDADKIAKDAMHSKEIVTKLCNFFSKDIFDGSGNIDRKKVANIAFSDQSKLKKLNGIIHPYVMKEIAEQINKLAFNNDFIILDVPLPNDDFKKLCDYIITVWSDLDNRITRIKTRSNFSEDEIIARIKKQMPQEDYEALANCVIYNNGSIEELNSKIDTTISQITH